MTSLRTSSALCGDAAERVLRRLDDLLAARFPAHPFQVDLHKANLVVVMSDYIAMSEAFPYLQASAIYENYRHCMDSHGRPDENVRTTAAVGAFLLWDEFGGHDLVLRSGAAGLSGLTDVDRQFHSALLVRDLEELLGVQLHLKPPSAITRAYLEQLRQGLSTSTGNRNLAYMTAFERHANVMIGALWERLRAIFKLRDMQGLRYFEVHIGSSTAGEAIHLRVTESMISRLLCEDEVSTFLETCLEAYALNVAWCRDVVASANSVGREARAASAP